MYEQLLEEERRSQTALLNQYYKELEDISNGTGLSAQISTGREAIARDLREHIQSIEKYLNHDLRIAEIVLRLDRLSNMYDNVSFGMESGDGTTVDEVNVILNQMHLLRSELDRLTKEGNNE